VYKANQFHDRMSRRPAESQSLSQNLADMTRTAAYFNSTVREQIQVSREAQALSLSQQRQVALMGARGEIVAGTATNATTTRTVIGVHICRQGDTSFSVSMKYYGTPDNAASMLRANKLSATLVRLPVGRPLVIPVIAARVENNG
jgi:hypothetical protein